MNKSPLAPGAKASRTQTISDEVIRAFADLTGDHNPIHLDENYAAGTRFGRRIAHGMIAASLISATLANDLPGHRLSQPDVTIQSPHLSQRYRHSDGRSQGRPV